MPAGRDRGSRRRALRRSRRLVGAIGAAKITRRHLAREGT